ncbi:HD domain containing protein [Oxalobacteraceae bacterium]
MITPRFSRALSLAIEAHDGDFRKGTTIPYISHPLAVASIALEYGADEDQAIAALLHDAIEDGGKKYVSLIEEQFGQRVLYLVEGCTDGVPDAHGRKTDWHERKRSYLEHLKQAHDDVLLISGADKLHNARAIVSDLKSVGQIVFERFSTKKDGTLWYYQSLADIFEAREMPMAKTIRETTSEMIALVS